MTLPSSRFAPWLLLTVLVLGSYANALGNDFAYDDRIVVLGNEAVRSLRTLPKLLLMRFHATTVELNEASNIGEYRPVSMLTVALDHAVWGTRPAGHHATSIVVHLLATFAVFSFLARLLADRAAGLLAAAFFAVHPLHTEAVTAIANRGDALAALLVLLSLAALCNALDASSAHQGRHFLLGIFLFLLAILSKESAAMLPALLVLLVGYDYLLHARGQTGWIGPRRANLREVLYVLAGLLIPIGVTLALRWRVEGGLVAPTSVFADTGASLPVRAGLLMQIFGDYVRLAVVGWPLSASYPWNSHYMPSECHLSVPALWAAFALLSASWVLVVASFRRTPIVAVCVAWFVLGIIPLSNVFVPAWILQADRSPYLSTVGSCALLGLFLARLWDWAGRGLRPLIGLALGVWIAAWGVATFLRNFDWVNNDTLGRSMVRTQPADPKGYEMLGSMYSRWRNWEAADECYRTLLEIPGHDWEGYQGLGKTRYYRGDPAGALPLLTAALIRDPLQAETHGMLGLTNDRLGHRGAAEHHYTFAYKLQPQSAKRVGDLGLYYLRQGRIDDALRFQTQAILLETGQTVVDEFTLRQGLARDAMRIDQPGLALPLLDRACELRPDDPAVHLDRGIARYLAQPDAHAAQEDFERCLLLRPEWADALRWRGIALRSLGRWDEAVRDLRAALQRNSLDHEAGRHLFLALVSLRRFPEAAQALTSFPELRTSGHAEVRAALATLAAELKER